VPKGFRTDATGVNESETADGRILHKPFMTINGDARTITNDRTSGAREAVEECGLAHVGGSDKDHF
jgi:hypothetical protein